MRVRAESGRRLRRSWSFDTRWPCVGRASGRGSSSDCVAVASSVRPLYLLQYATYKCYGVVQLPLARPRRQPALAPRLLVHRRVRNAHLQPCLQLQNARRRPRAYQPQVQPLAHRRVLHTPLVQTRVLLLLELVQQRVPTQQQQPRPLRRSLVLQQQIDLRLDLPHLLHQPALRALIQLVQFVAQLRQLQVVKCQLALGQRRLFRKQPFYRLQYVVHRKHLFARARYQSPYQHVLVDLRLQPHQRHPIRLVLHQQAV